MPLMCKLLKVTSNTVCFYPKQKIQLNLLQKKSIEGDFQWHDIHAWYNRLVEV
jgi:hypothetical protein